MPEHRLRRSILFFPADRPDRLARALASGADAVCIDMEDAVAPSAKADGRARAVEMLGDRPAGGAEVLLRINTPRSAEGLRDLIALLDGGAAAPDGVVIPKVDAAEEVRWVEALLPPHWSAVALIPMIETARGLSAADAIAAATPRVGGVILGGIDLSAELGCTRDWESLLYARSRVVHAAAVGGVEAIDLPWLAVEDAEGARRETEASARLGFGGKVLIHPSQVDPVHAGFAPAKEVVERARRVVQADRESGGGVSLLDGRLVERPVVRAAERTLARAAATEAAAAAAGR